MDRCYVLVGEDNYDDIELGVSGDNGSLVNRTLEPANFISVQSGDTVGYYITRQGCTSEEREQLQPNDGEEVWHSADASGNRYCAGTGGRDQECSQSEETSEASETSETSEISETIETSEISETSETSETSDSSDETEDESDTSAENLQRKTESSSRETLVLITNPSPVVNVDKGMHAS